MSFIPRSEKPPNPQELERELAEYVSKKYGDNIQVIPAFARPEREEGMGQDKGKEGGSPLDFDLKPEELAHYLDQYIIGQNQAKAVMATKICTHYNRVARAAQAGRSLSSMVGGVKNNVLVMGPTGVGKTYMLRLIAKRIGVPFVKGDATKFSETGYVGGDVEDLVRDLVREADGDMERAQCGIIYIDEIDKIASSPNTLGLDVSRTGVQRALLKPMEETEVDLKVPHDPVSMIQEIERFRRTGEKEPSRINTKNILFIMSGAFADLASIIKKRVAQKAIGFGSKVSDPLEDSRLLSRVTTQDLLAFGFESEFIGRLPIIAVLDPLSADDLYHILKNPNNPLILSKKLDFAAYGIDVRFTDGALKRAAKNAVQENIGARGLVSALERALLVFEKRLPSTSVKQFTVTEKLVKNPEKVLQEMLSQPDDPRWQEEFDRAARNEREWIARFVQENQVALSDRFDLKITPSRALLVADLYAREPSDIREVLTRVTQGLEQVKKLEVRLFQEHKLDVVFDDQAADRLIGLLQNGITPETLHDRFVSDFKDGFLLLREKTGKKSFFITKEALENPEAHLSELVRKSMKQTETDASS